MIDQLIDEKNTQNMYSFLPKIVFSVKHNTPAKKSINDKMDYSEKNKMYTLFLIGPMQINHAL